MKEINFSNAGVYSIRCKNPDIKDEYVGSTINFIKRRRNHRNRSNDKTDNCKVYKFINDNGGWDNWEMIELIKCPDVKSIRELQEIEYKYYIELKPTLNSKPPVSFTEIAQKKREYKLKRKDPNYIGRKKRGFTLFTF
jgi:hypothetical protein